VTVPLPLPAVLTVKRNWRRVKVAVTEMAASIVTTQGAGAGAATTGPASEQRIGGGCGGEGDDGVGVVELGAVGATRDAGGLEVTVPLPFPVRLTVSANCLSAKVAVTAIALSMVTVHVPVPEQPPPDQPVNTESAAGAVVNVTTVWAS